jgi:hypothetical protein
MDADVITNIQKENVTALEGRASSMWIRSLNNKSKQKGLIDSWAI